MVRDACRQLGSHVLAVLEPPRDEVLLSGQLVDESGQAALLVYKLLAWPAGYSSLPAGFADAIVHLGPSATEVLLVRNDYVDIFVIHVLSQRQLQVASDPVNVSTLAEAATSVPGWSGKTVQWEPFAHDEFKRRLDAERLRRFHEDEARLA